MIRTKIKKHSIVIISTLVILLSMLCLIGFYTSSAGTTLFLQDLFGQRDALNGIAIEGALNDAYHSLSFSIVNGRLDKKHQFYDNNTQNLRVFGIDTISFPLDVTASLEGRIPKGAQTSTQSADRDVPELSTKDHKMVERTVTTLSDSVSFYCTLHNWAMDSFHRTAWFKTDIALRSNEKVFRFERTYYDDGYPYVKSSSENRFRNDFSNEISAKLVTINGTHFLTLTTNAQCKGHSGIYRLDQWGDVFSENKEKNGEISKLVDIELNDGKVRVIGLEAVENKILLLLLIDDTLVIRSYDITGKLISELRPELPAFSNNRIVYHSFIKTHTISLGLFYDDVTMDKAAILSINTNSGLMLDGMAQSFSVEEGRYMRFLGIESVDGKLVVITAAHKKGILAEERYIKPSQIYLNILGNNGKWIYQGEMISDMADDYGIFTNASSITDAYFRYDQYSRRELVITGIEKASAFWEERR